MPIELLTDFLQTTNETLTSAIVILAASLLLFNLSKNLENRVARTSGIVLACITFVYICDVFISLRPSSQIYADTLRLQWIGVTFLPAAMFHLSDALLATTGLPSRGRRRRVIWITYIISAVFLLLTVFSDILIKPVHGDFGISLQEGSIFPIFAGYYILLNAIAFLFVDRARNRCLTSGTKRRMAYLQIGILTPAIGLFPYSVLLLPGEEFSIIGIFLVNLGNLIIILMLIFLSYPLSFFGSEVPDRVVKSELLRMLLRGPGTALLVLGVINYTTSATRILGLAGDIFLPFAVAATILIWQWSVATAMPYLEKKLIYHNDAEDEITTLEALSVNLLTRDDLLQLIEAILESACDYLQVGKAFITVIRENQQHEIIQDIGIEEIDDPLLSISVDSPHNPTNSLFARKWDDFWIIPLYSSRAINGGHPQNLIGYMGIESHADRIAHENDEEQILRAFVKRAEQTLDNIILQSEIFASLEGLLPQFSITPARAAEISYRPGYQAGNESQMPSREQIFEQVRAALRHYWGGPGISRSRLVELKIVQDELDENTNLVNAIRAILRNAIEQQKPEGERQLTNPEWTIYNILRMRFVENKKVSTVAHSLAMSQSDFYRKQKAAIEVLTDSIIQMETERRNHNNAP